MDLYNRVRSKLVSKNTSLNKWCIENEVVYSTIRSALIGASNSKNAKAHARDVCKFAGVAIPERLK